LFEPCVLAYGLTRRVCPYSYPAIPCPASTRSSLGMTDDESRSSVLPWTCFLCNVSSPLCSAGCSPGHHLLHREPPCLHGMTVKTAVTASSRFPSIAHEIRRAYKPGCEPKHDQNQASAKVWKHGVSQMSCLLCLLQAQPQHNLRHHRITYPQYQLVICDQDRGHLFCLQSEGTYRYTAGAGTSSHSEALVPAIRCMHRLDKSSVMAYELRNPISSKLKTSNDNTVISLPSCFTSASSQPYAEGMLTRPPWAMFKAQFHLARLVVTCAPVLPVMIV
jgi:hypothetical protein